MQRTSHKPKAKQAWQREPRLLEPDFECLTFDDVKALDSRAYEALLEAHTND